MVSTVTIRETGSQRGPLSTPIWGPDSVLIDSLPYHTSSTNAANGLDAQAAYESMFSL